MTSSARVADMAARDSYGRLLAYLSSRTHDIALAEDALADAFVQALDLWPTRGVPDNPDAWLLTTARNRLTDRQRHQTRFPTKDEIPDMPADDTSPALFPDERLALLMVCAHPSIASDLHVPLMLQTVLGLEAKTIARLFLVSPTALTKRLGRAKAKIRDAGIPFHIPDAAVLPSRATTIHEAIYGLHAYDWLNPADDLGDEALYLADLMTKLMPENSEGLALAALIALSHARANARIVNQTLVPTEDQDTSLWDKRLIFYGRQTLARAYTKATVGRFQIEAAIEAVHIARKDSGRTDWEALNKLYYALLQIAPSLGALVAQAAVVGRLHGPQAGLDALDAMQDQAGTGFQPYWAARAMILAELGQVAEAITCFEKAISLATDSATITLLTNRRDALHHG
ncbi:DUF6596 domain-containing protein [uncultured Pelagimonas sp.]|uniref:RNA polymerase sigma factor n=1 Tax=uncultured Pelagimonas sp. TaxID=1618102 RepID=UPI002604B997|nr:DUF6596 domain-containing protein [uncultured Pelagimonas sp.]